MEVIIDTGMVLYGCPLFAKVLIDEAEYRRDMIKAFFESQMPQVKSKEEYRHMARKTLGLRV